MRLAIAEGAIPGLVDEVKHLLQQHLSLVFRTAYRTTGGATDAQDVLQTAFLHLMVRAASSPLLENCESYLRRAAAAPPPKIARMPGISQVRVAIALPQSSDSRGDRAGEGGGEPLPTRTPGENQCNLLPQVPLPVGVPAAIALDRGNPIALVSINRAPASLATAITGLLILSVAVLVFSCMQVRRMRIDYGAD